MIINWITYRDSDIAIKEITTFNNKMICTNQESQVLHFQQKKISKLMCKEEVFNRNHDNHRIKTLT